MGFSTTIWQKCQLKNKTCLFLVLKTKQKTSHENGKSLYNRDGTSMPAFFKKGSCYKASLYIKMFPTVVASPYGYILSHIRGNKNAKLLSRY